MILLLNSLIPIVVNDEIPWNLYLYYIVSHGRKEDGVVVGVCIGALVLIDTQSALGMLSWFQNLPYLALEAQMRPVAIPTSPP